MDPERWKQIDKIFHAALNRDPSARAAFLAEACKEDDSLRAEVETLIASHEKESSFFETPPSDLAAEFLDKKKVIYEGKIAHYKILRKIGSGGMGEVYLAEDTRLNRKVALKLLPSEFTNDNDRVRRFEREAKAASALNHPNILTIYDIGQFNSSSFIASEYIDGETLRERMRESKMPLEEILAVSIQVAEALDAAHQAGIIHCDIKPENIMLRKDGYVKVLDFGLAKLTETQTASSLSRTDTQSLAPTKPGMIFGTVRYMSPEQARGLKLDARSDLFSFGIVLYELITSHPPFDGLTSSDVFVSILEKNPLPLRSYDEFSDELQWIISKTLSKDVEERYQTAKDLLTDLKRFRKHLESNQEMKLSGSSDFVQHIQKKRKLAIPAILLTALLGVAFLWFAQKQEKASTIHKAFSKIKLTRLTSSGSIFGGAISPDGKYVAYVERSASGLQSLYLKQLSVDSQIKIMTLPPKTFFYRPRQEGNALRFSPDGQYIYYRTSSVENVTRLLYRIPVLGGIPQKLIEEVHSIPSFSPDGKNLAFLRSVNDEDWIMTARIDGSDQRKIKGQKSDYDDIEWSPDGKMLTLIKRVKTQGHVTKQIVGINLNDFSERIIFDTELAADPYYDDLQWLSDGSGMITTKLVEGKRQIYYVSYPDGEFVPITNDPSDYKRVSLTADNKFLATTQRTPNYSIWTAPFSRPDDMAQLTSGSIIQDGARGISWAPDGKIIYQSQEPSGEFQLWSINHDGTNRTRITTGKTDKKFPACSPDGRYIVYASNDSEFSQVWRSDSNGENPKLLSSNKQASWPLVSPDSKWVVYATFDGKDQTLLRMDVNGKHKILLSSHKYLYGAAISPNGSNIAYVYEDPEKSPDIFINIIPSNGGAPIKRLLLNEDISAGTFHWTPDGSGIAYIQGEEGGSNIYVQPVDGSSVRRLTHLTGDAIVNFSWSMDGKNIAYSRGKRTSDIVLIQDVP